MALHLPGYRFCGPGTDLNSAGEPVNELDAACRRHDENYGSNMDTHEADNRLAKEALASDSYAGVATFFAMKAKQFYDPASYSDYMLRSANDPGEQGATVYDSADINVIPGQEVDPNTSGDNANISTAVEASESMEIQDADQPQPPTPAPAAAAGSSGSRAGGSMSAGGSSDTAVSKPMCTPFGRAPVVRTFRNRCERRIWNTKAQDWAIERPTGDQSGMYTSWSDHFEFTDRHLPWYISASEFQHAINDCVAYRVNSASWKIVEVQVFIHSQNDGTTKYATYQGIDPKVYLMTNPNLMWPYRRLAHQERVPPDGSPPPATDQLASRIIDADMQSRYRCITLPRVKFGTKTKRHTDPTGGAGAFSPGDPVLFSGDKSADYEFRHYTSMSVQGLVGFGRRINCWPHFIRNTTVDRTRGLQFNRGVDASDGRHFNAFANSYIDPGSGGRWSDLGRYILPLGPVPEQPISWANPLTGQSPWWGNPAPGMNHRMNLKLQDIVDPAGFNKEITVEFTIETSVTLEMLYDYNCLESVAIFKMDGNMDDRIGGHGFNRFHGKDLAPGFYYPDATRTAMDSTSTTNVITNKRNTLSYCDNLYVIQGGADVSVDAVGPAARDFYDNAKQINNTAAWYSAITTVRNDANEDEFSD